MQKFWNSSSMESLRRRTTFHLILPLVEILLRDAVCGDEDVAGVEQRPGAAQPLGGPGAVRPHHRPGTDPPGVRGVTTIVRNIFTIS